MRWFYSSNRKNFSNQLKFDRAVATEMWVGEVSKDGSIYLFRLREYAAANKFVQ